MYRILNKSSSFDSVFKFYEETFFNTTADVSKKFPKYLLEFFIAESYVDQINLIYSFLNDISKPEFYEEILIVLDLKYSAVSETKTTHEPISKSIPESSTLHKPIPKSIPESSTVHKPIPKYIPEFNTVHEHIPQTIPETTPATVPLPVFDKKNLRKSPKNQNQKLPLSSLHIKPENSLQRPSNLKPKKENNVNKRENITRKDEDKNQETQKLNPPKKRHNLSNSRKEQE
ncbi:hypothetical protein CWI36_0692p0010 [Hamiltosporidium magnivora]|uniref:Uncharacterized protein n=1 Tax=Hamiltosporidium magnivora TaxID=148818 RepID=A0A4Q9LAZ6_9MICR|nr:hypothetical protein CWI36_0692p0010 [Hamiltosporidium magnivora]